MIRQTTFRKIASFVYMRIKNLKETLIKEGIMFMFRNIYLLG